MAVVSIQYFIFLIILATIFWLTKRPAIKKVVLAAGSLAFTSFFNWASLVVVLFMCIANYFLLKRLYDSKEQNIKKKLYLSGIILNAVVLTAYKLVQLLIAGSYLKNSFVLGNNWVVLGLAFYTLQIIGFYFEVFKKRVPFTHNFLDFTLSTLFFAKLSAGPILKINEALNENIYKSKSLSQADLIFAIQRILLGLFKKIALADRLLPYVSTVFDEHNYINGITIYLGPILFTMQLYFDFSAYMDIAVGSSRLFGIRLPENFNMPLRATSITLFWRRWHITLVTWLTNYIFLPISFRYRKMKNKGLFIAILCTFLISAAWHGLGVTFFIWAFCHFSYIILENTLLKKDRQEKKKNWLSKFLLILVVWHLLAFGNIFFRAHSLNDALQLFTDFKRLPFLLSKVNFKTWLINGGRDIEVEFNYRLSILLSIAFLVFERKVNEYANSEKYNVLYVALMLVGIIVFGMFNTGEQFLYMQF